MSNLNLDELQAALREWSDLAGYSKDFPSLVGDRSASHNVVRVNPASRQLFVGTCVADQDLRATPLGELTRVMDQLGAFVELLRVYQGGVFALATNDAASSGDWEGALSLLGVAAGLLPPPARPRFASTNLRYSSAIVFWTSTTTPP